MNAMTSRRSSRHLFDRSRLELRPLDQRKHLLHLDRIRLMERPASLNPTFKHIALKIREALAASASVTLMMGAHVIRDGVQRYLIDLMERGLIDCIAMNGAGAIHDFEFSLVGGTTERVSDTIRDGSFGFWMETGRINDIVKEGAAAGEGLGEAVGRVIQNEGFPHRELSLLASGYRLGIPVTVHVSIGQDIVHQHPNCSGEAYGAASYRDFLRLAGVMERLENGVVMSFGSAVMAPEVFLKALSMVRNAARRDGMVIRSFTTLVCDLIQLPENYRVDPPSTDPRYYFRPWKTMLARTVIEGGESHYVQGRHADTVPQLWAALCGEGDHARR